MTILNKNPNAADLKTCEKGGDEVCIPDLRKIKLPLPRVGGEIKRKLAYLIGNNDYKDGVPKLETPINDVTEIAQVLERQYGYQVQVLKNATRRELVSTLRKLTESKEQDESVMLFYAGHGYQSEDNGMGFWIPTDGSPQDPSTWLSNSDISKFLAAIPAKQVMLVSDSCFSGTLAKEQDLSADKKLSREEILGRRTVAVMSSGGEEPVSDEGKDGHSIFAWNFIKQLQQGAGSAVGSQFFEKVKQAVQTEYPQHPRYGASVQAGHMQGGDYLLEMKK